VHRSLTSFAYCTGSAIRVSLTRVLSENSVEIDILLPKRLGTPDTLGRACFELRIFDERAKPKGTAIPFRGNGPSRKWRRGQGSADAPQGFACTGKLNDVHCISHTPSPESGLPLVHRHHPIPLIRGFFYPFDNSYIIILYLSLRSAPFNTLLFVSFSTLYLSPLRHY